MRGSRFSFEEKQRLLKKIDENNILDIRRRRLFNRKYRKSLLFVSIWIGRVIFIVLFIVVCLLHFKPKNYRNEVVLEKEIYTLISNRSSDKTIEVDIKTNLSKYKSFLQAQPPDFNVGDTLIIDLNVFGKPIYFSKKYWQYKFELHKTDWYYYIILTLTFVSFFCNDGFDRFTDKLLLFIWTVDIFAIIMYFFT